MKFWLDNDTLLSLWKAWAGEQAKGGFPVKAETTRNHIFSKEISQVIIAAMVLAPNFYWKNGLRVISAMRGNPP